MKADSSPLSIMDVWPVFVVLGVGLTISAAYLTFEILKRNDMIDKTITKDLNHDLLADPNENYDILHNHIKTLKDKHLPEKYVKFHKLQHDDNN